MIDVTQCRNCAAALAPAQAFCGSCGQKSSVGRLTLHQMGHDLVHALTHVDHSIFALIKGLLIHPGRVAREYLEGRRKKHFGPLAFLIITVGLASFMILVSGVQWFEPINDTRLAGLLQRHINLVILLQMPLLAAICAGFFFRERLHYAEHVVFAAYTSGMRCLFLALVATPVMYFSHASSASRGMLIGYYVIWVLYFAYASAQFFRGNRAWNACKGMLAALLSQGLILELVFLLMVASARYATASTAAEGCYLDGPGELIPAEVLDVRLGMTFPELTRVLGAPDYSPTEGQYYFSTGGDCPLEHTEHSGGCGVIAEFRDYDDSNALKTTLQFCSWGGIGE